MRRLFLCLVLCLMLAPVFSAPALANDNIPMQDLTCAEFLEILNASGEEEIGYIFMWLDGYLSGVSGDTVINWDGMQQLSEKMIDYCGARGSDNVLKVARKLGISK